MKKLARRNYAVWRAGLRMRAPPTPASAISAGGTASKGLTVAPADMEKICFRNAQKIFGIN